MFKKSAIAALAIVVSGTAFTASASQLAERLGVEPGVFTTAELIQLDQAREDNDKAYENFLLSKADAATRGVSFAASSNEAIAKAHAIANNDDDENKHTIESFERALNGEFPVSEETVAFAKAHLATDIEDES